jgi:coatomer subunit beta
VKTNFPRLLQDQIIDILRVIQTPSNEIRKKVINLTLDLLSPRNINDVVRVLKKEIVQLQSSKIDEDYQHMLLLALHKCAVCFPEITGQHNLVDLLMDYCLIGTSPQDVAMFLQELVVKYENLRE